MRLELGTRVSCADGEFGELADVVVDPTTRRVTHLVVEPRGEHRLARLVPIELAEAGEAGDAAIRLGATVAEVDSLPAVQEVSYLRVGAFPADDPDWDVGIQEVFALPYFPMDDVATVGPADVVSTYDRIPRNEVEIRRASPVDSADGRRLGHVDGFVVDRDGHITHLVLEHGHLWGRREITIPIDAVAAVETDLVTLRLDKDAVEALPDVPVKRWSPPS